MEVIYVAFAFLVGWGFGRSERDCDGDTFREDPTRAQVKWYGSSPDNPMRGGGYQPRPAPSPSPPPGKE